MEEMRKKARRETNPQKTAACIDMQNVFPFIKKAITNLMNIHELQGASI